MFILMKNENFMGQKGAPYLIIEAQVTAESELRRLEYPFIIFSRSKSRFVWIYSNSKNSFFVMPHSAIISSNNPFPSSFFLGIAVHNP